VVRVFKSSIHRWGFCVYQWASKLPYTKNTLLIDLPLCVRPWVITPCSQYVFIVGHFHHLFLTLWKPKLCLCTWLHCYKWSCLEWSPYCVIIIWGILFVYDMWHKMHFNCTWKDICSQDIELFCSPHFGRFYLVCFKPK